jgi:hypothetical protein
VNAAVCTARLANPEGVKKLFDDTDRALRSVPAGNPHLSSGPIAWLMR